MNKKWLDIQFPYYFPESGTSDSGGNTEADAEFLAEGEDNKTDDKIDNDDDDKSAENEKKRDKKTSSDRLRDKIDSEDDEGKDDKKENGEDKFGEEFEEDDEAEELEDGEEKTEETDEAEDEEVENEFTVRALKKEFPNIFKKFPEVKDAIFRERMFTKIFGTVDEAEESAQKAKYLDDISQEIFEGKSENLLKSLKKNSEQSLKIFASQFLPELYKTDKDLYHEISDNLVNQMLHVVNSHAIKQNNKNLATAVKYISQFVFADENLPELKPLAKREQKTEKEIELEKKEQEYENRRYTEFEDSVHSRGRAKLEAIVKEGFKDEDMTDFVKDAITDKIIDKVGVIIAKDQFFQRQLSSLWKKAAREGFTGEAKSRIISAYLARAKKIVPSVRAQVRKDATSRSNNNRHTEESDNNGKRQGTSSGSGKRHSSLPTDPKKIPASITDEDLLGMD